MSDRHDRTLAIAAELAEQSGGEITLFHVVQEIHGLPRDADPAFYQRLDDLARGHLDKLLDRVRGRVVGCRAEIRVGERGPEVLRYAREANSDLIVLTSHSVDPAAPGADWVTLSHLIGIGSPCPVLLVK
jgi:nucleotide-binding universal stress UspA family protein